MNRRVRGWYAVVAAMLAGSACTLEIVNLPGAPGPATPDAATGSDAAAPDGSATCAAVIDQQLGECQSPPITQCGNSASNGLDSAVAQVFTPASTGTLTRVRLWMSNDDPARNRVEVSIADLQQDPAALLDPSFAIEDHVLASTQTAMTSQVTWQDAVFARPPAVVANHPYAIQMRLAASGGPLSSARWVIYNDYMGPMLDLYPRGNAYGRAPGTNNLWIVNPSYRDLVFEVHVAPATCP